MTDIDTIGFSKPQTPYQTARQPDQADVGLECFGISCLAKTEAENLRYPINHHRHGEPRSGAAIQDGVIKSAG